MICDKCGVDLPESVFWDDECTMCHSEARIKQLEAENQLLYELLDRIKYMHSIDEAIESVQKALEE